MGWHFQVSDSTTTILTPAFVGPMGELEPYQATRYVARLAGYSDWDSFSARYPEIGVPKVRRTYHLSVIK